MARLLLMNMWRFADMVLRRRLSSLDVCYLGTVLLSAALRTSVCVVHWWVVLPVRMTMRLCALLLAVCMTVIGLGNVVTMDWTLELSMVVLRVTVYF